MAFVHGAAEEVVVSGTVGGSSERAVDIGVPRPNDWQVRSKRARRNWYQRNVWNGKYEGSE